MQFTLAALAALHGLVAAEQSYALMAALLAWSVALGVASVLLLKGVRRASVACGALDGALVLGGVALGVLASGVRWVGLAYAAIGAVPLALLMQDARKA